MKIIRTENQTAFAKGPTRLEVLRELHKRGALPGKMKEEWRNLELGDEGERFVLEKLAGYGSPEWSVVSNLWLDYEGPFECDLIVLTRAGLYPIEVKNYSGDHEYRNYQCWVNGDKVGFNAVSQAQRSCTNLERLVHSALPAVQVSGALAFVGEHHTVTMHDPVDAIQVVMRNELRSFIWEMAKEERHFRGPLLDVRACMELFERYEVANRYGPVPITGEISARMQKGICCSHCGSFDVDTSRSTVVCTCGLHEPFENAIVRTICEYGVIHFDKQLVTSEVLDFFGGDVSKSTLTKYLKKHFTRAGTGPNTYFHNFSTPMNRNNQLFQLKSRSFSKDSY